MAGLCLEGAAPWLKRIEVASGPEASYANEFWRLWDILAAVEREFVPKQDDEEEPYNTALNAAGGSLADALIEVRNAIGTRKISPIIRIGHVAAIPDEPIRTRYGKMEALLIQAMSIGGLSGSPVLLSVPAYR